MDECTTDETLCGNNTGECVNLVNQGYNCSCFSGFDKRIDWPAGTTHCVDTNECNLEEDVCPGPYDFCQNTHGSFDCPCESSGFHRTSEESDCSDVDECSSETDLCPGPFDVCQNELGSFICRCESDGYERLSESENCTDVDECDTKCLHALETCNNTIGNFTCECNLGFHRSSNSSECQDVNECDANTHNCDVGMDAYCLNTAGSFECGRVFQQFLQLFLNYWKKTRKANVMMNFRKILVVFSLKEIA